MLIGLTLIKNLWNVMNNNKYKFSERSEQILNTVRLELNILAHKVLELEINPIDFSITEGYRSIERQKQLYQYILVD